MACKTIWVGAVLAILFCRADLYAQQDLNSPTVLDGKPLLHPLFSENAVLQRDRIISIWGWAQPGTAVEIKLDGRRQTANAGQDNRWAVSIPPHAAGGPHTLTVTNIKTGESIQRQNILFGDVWLCSGQSNMAYDVRGANNAEKEIAAADYPQLRLLRIPGSLTATPQQTFDRGAWQECTPKSIIEFAGVGYFFGRDLHQALKVPIGLIDSSASGTVAQAWVSAPALAAMADFKQTVETLTAPSRTPTPITDPNTPTVLFNGKIAPLLPVQLKGIIWYQGESNGDRRPQAVQYRTLLPILVNDWRKHFGEKTPFYIVQLSNFRHTHDQPNNTDVWPLLREAQFMASQDLKAPLVVTMDLGEVTNVHYHNKQEVGIRLMKAVMNHTYGSAEEGSGPMFRSAKVGGASIELVFDHAEGLYLKGDINRAFAIAGADKKFFWATPKISGATVTLQSADVPVPLYARFAWSDNPLSALYNAENLPASPFRTSQQDDADDENTKGGKQTLKERADAVFNYWNDAFLIRDKGQTYYSRTLKNLGNQSEGSWVFALDLEVAQDAYERTRSPEHRQLVIDLLDTFLIQNSSDWSGNTWNDDMAWMATALARGFQLTGDKKYLDKAAHAWNLAFDRGWDTKYGGGGIWENMDNFVHGEGKADKCALSNTALVYPGILLYQATGDPAYLKKCQAIYGWMRKNVFNAKTGQVNEGIKWFIGKPDSGWLEESNNVYNSGNFLQATTFLYRITGDQAYYDDAVLTIENVMKKPVMANGGRYQTQWQYRFVKGMAQFATDNRLWSKYYPWMLQNAEAAWSQRDSNNLTWNDWIKVTNDPKINANETSSAVAIWQVLPTLDRPELEGTFLIQNAGSKLALAVASVSNGTPITLEHSASSNAMWTFVPTSGGFFQIKNAKSGLLLSVQNASCLPEAKIVQHLPPKIDLCSDQWWVVKNADGTYSFYNLNSNQALDVPDNRIGPGTQMNQWYANEQVSQKFLLITKH